MPASASPPACCGNLVWRIVRCVNVSLHLLTILHKYFTSWQGFTKQRILISVTPRALHNLIPIFPLSIQLHQTYRNQTYWNLIEPTPITIMHILSVHRNYGEVIYGLMIPTRYIGSQVYTADTMTHYSTLPMVFYFSKWAPLYISYSSLLFKPPCIPSYFSSFRIELRTSPLLIPNHLPKGLTLFLPTCYSYQFLHHCPQYNTQEIRWIPKTYNSD